MKISVTAPAKVNLNLHVIGQRADGYHLLDSVVVFADFGDEITLTPSDRYSLTIDGPFAAAIDIAPEDNLVLQAARAVAPPVAVHLTKNLPVAAGIGGGSADAAAVIRGAVKLFDLPAPSMDVLVGLGADVPICYAGQVAIMAGIGDVITPIPDFAPKPAVLINPLKPVSTPVVFANLSAKANPPLPPLVDALDFWRDETRNDLEPPARALLPEITDCIAALAASGADLARMSGSGATCFGLYADRETAAAAADALRAKFPNYWVQDCILGNAEFY